MYEDAILIVFIAFCTASFGEAITWLLVYRSDHYKKLKAEIDRKTKKLEKRKELASDVDKSSKRRMDRDEDRLKATNRDMSLFKMKSMFAIGFAFTALLSTFNNIFDGRVVARLPFEPISWIQSMTHRGLRGEDYTECSFIGLYILCTMSIRQNLQKMLGFAPSRAMNRQSGQTGMFGMPAPTTQQSNQYSYFR